MSGFWQKKQMQVVDADPNLDQADLYYYYYLFFMLD